VFFLLQNTAKCVFGATWPGSASLQCFPRLPSCIKGRDKEGRVVMGREGRGKGSEEQVVDR